MDCFYLMYRRIQNIEMRIHRWNLLSPYLQTKNLLYSPLGDYGIGYRQGSNHQDAWKMVK